MKSSHSRILQAVLTVMFGAVPATLLCVYALLGAIVGFLVLLTDPAIGIAMLVSSIVGVIGTIGLWRAAFRPVSDGTAKCLVVGLYGVVGAFFFLIVFMQPPNVLLLMLLAGPAIVAIFHLSVRQRSTQRAEPAQKKLPAYWQNF